MKIQEIVKDINEKLFDSYPDCSFFLDYIERGYVEFVLLHVCQNNIDIEIGLWCSEDEPRNFNETTNKYEDFDKYMKRKIKETIKSLQELNRIL